MQILLRTLAFCFGMAILTPWVLAQKLPEPLRPNSFNVDVPLRTMQEGKQRVIVADDKNATKKNREIIKTMAVWMAHRVAFPPYNGEQETKAGSEPKSINTLFDELNRWLLVAGPAPSKLYTEAQNEYAKEFAKAMADEVKLVLSKSTRPIERINAARMLSVVAKTPAPDIADTFLEWIKDEKEAEPIKLYAFQGLKNLIEQSDQNDQKAPLIADPVKQLAIAKTLTDYITKPREVPQGDTNALEVVRFIRRDAIRALGTFRDATIKTKDGKMIRPSVTLMRIALDHDTIQPPPSLTEKVEALSGFLHMRMDRTMDLVTASYAVNQAVYNLIIIHGDKTREVELNTVPWKVAGAKISLGLITWKKYINELAASVPNKPIAIQLSDLVIENAGKKFESDGIKAIPNTTPLTDWAKDNSSKADRQYRLYENDDASTLLSTRKLEKKEPEKKK